MVLQIKKVKSYLVTFSWISIQEKENLAMQLVLDYNQDVWKKMGQDWLEFFRFTFCYYPTLVYLILMIL